MSPAKSAAAREREKLEAEVASETAPPEEPTQSDADLLKAQAAEIEELKKAAAKAEERPMPTNVIAALARVAEELPGIGKNEESEQGYRYRGIEAITAHAQTLLGRYGVVFVPRVLDRVTKDLSINNRPWTEEQLTVLYTVYGPGGVEDKIEVGPLHGLGRDNSDKGTNKALTQVFKYALLQVLCVGDSKDDADRDVAAVADAPTMSPDEWAQKLGYDDDQEKRECDALYKEIGQSLDAAGRARLKQWKAQANWGWPLTIQQWRAVIGFARAGLPDEMTVEEAEAFFAEHGAFGPDVAEDEVDVDSAADDPQTEDKPVDQPATDETVVTGSFEGGDGSSTGEMTDDEKAEAEHEAEGLAQEARDMDPGRPF